MLTTAADTVSAEKSMKLAASCEKALDISISNTNRCITDTAMCAATLAEYESRFRASLMAVNAK